MGRLKSIFTSIMLAISLTFCYAQVDTAFWFAVPKLTSEHAHTPITLVVSTYDEAATITVTKAYSGTQVGTTLNVAANSSNTLTLVSNSSCLSGFECNHNQTSNNGLYIHSTAKISAYVAVCQNNSEIYALKGANGLGTAFFVTTQFQYANGNGSSSGAYSQAKNKVEIIATENNTTVTITPSKACVGHAANVPFTVTLQRGQVYTLAASSQAAANHLGGTIITSNNPIAVDVSDDSVTPYCTETTDNGGGSADLVGDQLVPESMAGSEYVVVPSPSNVNNNAPATSGGNYYLDYAFVYALEDNTDVNIVSGNINNPTITPYSMNRGDKQKYHFTNNNPVYIYANRTDPITGDIVPASIFVFQITGAGKEFGGTQLPPVNCTGSRSVGYRPLQSANGNNKSLYLTLLCDAAYTSGFQINGNSNIITASDWSSVPLGPYKYCRKNVSSNFAPSATNMVTFRVTNSLGKFHMGVFDINGSYDDCSISYFSNYTTESSIKFDPDVTFSDYCQGDTIVFGFDTVDATIYRIVGPNNYQIMQEPFYRAGVQPEQSGWYKVVAMDSRGCTSDPMYDSVYITVHPSVYETVYDTICPGTAYTGYGFTVPASSTTDVGTYLDTLLLQTVEMGCDSFLILELNIRDSVKRETVYDTVCPGHAYTGFGGLFHFPADSTAIPHVLTDSVHLPPVGYACDSVLTLMLTVRDSVFGEFSHIACNQYSWNGHTYVESGDYNQTLTDAHGCDSIVTMHLEIVEPAVEIVTSGEDFCEHGEIVLNALAEYGQYTWNTGDTTQFLPVTQPGLYTVTVTQGDCQAYDNYHVDACDFTIILPNAITPSKSDGLNDCLFLPQYVHRFLSDFSIEIFNRWGSLIYYSNDMNFQWCGEVGNRPEDMEKDRHVMNGQVYIWFIHVKNLDGKPFVYKGTITVL